MGVPRPASPATRPPIEALPEPALRARREQRVAGLSRRSLLRASLAGGIGLWLAEVVGGTLGFWWSAITVAAPRVRVGTFEDLVAASTGLPVRDGFPAYVAEARAFVV